MKKDAFDRVASLPDTELPTQPYGPGWIKSVSVYCGSTTSNCDNFVVEAFKLGRLLIQDHKTIYYGGGNSGLMGALQYGAVQQAMDEQLPIEEIKKLIIGVNLECFVQGERDQGESDAQIHEFAVESMAVRKAHFVDNGDVAVALPGSYGTFDEFGDSGMAADLSAIYNPKGYVHPVIFANLPINAEGDRYYDGMKKQLDTIAKVSFSTQERTDQIFHFRDSADSVVASIKELNASPPLLPHQMAPKRTLQTLRPYQDILEQKGLICKPKP